MSARRRYLPVKLWNFNRSVTGTYFEAWCDSPYFPFRQNKLIANPNCHIENLCQRICNYWGSDTNKNVFQIKQYTVLSKLLPDVMWDSSHRHLSVGLPWYPMLYQALADLGWSRYIPEMLIRINLIFTIGPRIYHLANITMDRWIHWGEGVQEGCTLAGCVCVI
jgi:hypothetical protein